MKKSLAIVFAVMSVIAIIFPLVLAPLVVLFTPSQFDYTLNGGLDEKYDRLMSIEEEKIIVIGGSSVAFGLDSETLERYTGRPVVNFGLYADLGTKLMLDLSRPGIGEGDIIVLAPELDEQTLSLYFSAEQTLMALDGRPDMVAKLPVDDVLSLVGGSFSFAYDKLACMNEGMPNPEGVYNSQNLNEYGDIDYPRAENIMPQYYAPNKTVNLSPWALDTAEFNEFIDYVNDYIGYAKRRGATVLFSFCPVNELGIAEGVTELDILEYEEKISEKIDCPVISDIKDYIMEAGYFYDTNFHLNEVGAELRTLRLAKDIRFECEITAGILPMDEPEAPALPGLDTVFEGIDENDRYFLYEEISNGSYAIVGLSDLALGLETLTVPLGYNGRKVTVIKEGAFSGSLVASLVITADSNIQIVETGAFFGASNLKEVKIYKNDPNTIAPPFGISGVHEDFRFYTPAGAYYKVHYEWSRLKDLILETL